ncbi:hypothetical protein HYH03_011803 [Edaphochlamys debaryana]|uniref:Peptidase M11 gametolysin domain-containing protein n=1 Tax=Edaphochlamys debaryana TaxID=47281 RepID=A0A835Y239_9CHLO|nr:hypothetical protein HYH03_011803 [Edaphochlamys debaryana]|eukprot:KAG2489694.1 hypothetical protein HYH03_011803 [Edaphochlamys debaryana]
MHELSHTQGLSHAARGLDTYGDRGDVMGSAGNADGYLCMNPGNQLRVGWNSPIASLRPETVNTASNVNQRGVYRIPNLGTTDVNHVFINMTVPDKPYANHLVSYRLRTPTFDAILSSEYNNRVHIHQFNGTASDRDDNRTWLMALLSPGQWYMSRFVDYGVGAAAGGALNFTVLNITDGHAYVRICHATVRSEDLCKDCCGDGIDNDCDGLADANDRECSTTPLSMPPPPSPLAAPHQSACQPPCVVPTAATQPRRALSPDRCSSTA